MMSVISETISERVFFFLAKTNLSERLQNISKRKRLQERVVIVRCEARNMPPATRGLSLPRGDADNVVAQLDGAVGEACGDAGLEFGEGERAVLAVEHARVVH